MNKTVLLHRLVPGVISFFMLFSAYISGTRATEFAHLGFPDYFRIELTAAKVLGAFLLLLPWTPARVREWIYVSFTIVLLSAAIAKYNSGYPPQQVIEPLIVLTIMIGALFLMHRLDHPKDLVSLL